MTSLHDLTIEAEPFVASFAAIDLTATPSDGAPALAGPLTTIDFTSPDDSSTFAPVSITVRSELPPETLDQLVSACASVSPGLNAGEPVAAASVADVPLSTGPLDADAPISVLAISAGPDLIGMLVTRSDRRSGESTSTYEPPSSAQPGPAATVPMTGGLAMLRDVMLDVTVELGRDSLTLAQMMNLTIGSVVELDRAAGSPVDIRVNGILFGRGEVVVVDDEYAVRMVEIVESSGRRS